MENQKQQEQPITFMYADDAKVTLTSQEFEVISQPLRAFEMALSVINMKSDQMIQEGKLLPVFKSDCQTKVDNNGVEQIMVNERRVPILKDKEAFFNKNKPKIQTVSNIVDSNGAPMN